MKRGKPFGFITQSGTDKPVVLGIIFNNPTAADFQTIKTGWMLPDLNKLSSDYFKVSDEVSQRLEQINKLFGIAEGDATDFYKKAKASYDATIRSLKTVIDEMGKQLMTPDKIVMPLRDASIEVLPPLFDKYALNTWGDYQIENPIKEGVIPFNNRFMDTLALPEYKGVKEALEAIEGRKIERWTDVISPGEKVDFILSAFGNKHEGAVETAEYFLSIYGVSFDLLLKESLAANMEKRPIRHLYFPNAVDREDLEPAPNVSEGKPKDGLLS